MKVVDTSNPAQPTIVATYNTPGWANAVALSGNYVYVAVGAQGLSIVNISNPLAQLNAGFVDTPGNAKVVTVLGSLGYVTDMTALSPAGLAAYGLHTKLRNC